jgi:hypothetical protein
LGAVVTLTNQQIFAVAEADLQAGATFARVYGLNIVKFSTTGTPVPFMIRTGELGCGSPLEKKLFQAIYVYGNGPGTVRVRVFIDKHYVCDGKLVFAELPNDKRKLNLPLRRSKGYVIDVELASTGKPRGIEVAFEPVEE